MDSLYKRMLLVPELEYSQMKHCHSEGGAAASNPSTALWPSSSEMGSSEREQKLYALSLAKQRESDQSSANVTEPRGKSDFSREILLLPATFRARAQRLYTLLEKHRPTYLDWDSSGAVIFDRYGPPLHGSNLIDLIYHATAVPRRRNFEPAGWPEFSALLQQLNVPLSILNKETQAEMSGEPLPPPQPKIATPSRIPVMKGRGAKWIRV